MSREPTRPVCDDPERSRIMRAVKRSKTAPEVALQSALCGVGLRPDTNRRDLPGSPDIVFPQERLAVFVHGCFWHRHARCRLSTEPKTNRSYWQQKFAANVTRDRRKARELRRQGWKAITVWQCQVAKNAAAVAQRIKIALEKRRLIAVPKVD